MRLGILAIFAVFLLASCGSSRSAYTDRVSDLNPEDADVRFVELAGLVAKTPADDAVNLVANWKKMLSEDAVTTPLNSGTTYTFVFYDVSKRLEAVWLDASFSPDSPIPLWRWESTHLFYRTFTIYKPAKLRYRFTADSNRSEAMALRDPLHPSVDGADPTWSIIPDPSTTQLHKIDSGLEPLLAGQDLEIFLPPDYDRDVSRVWPLMVILGQGESHWQDAAQAGIVDGTLIPMVIVAVQPRPGAAVTAAGFVAAWNTGLKLWLATHTRADTTAPGTFLLGWGPLARVVQEAAPNHPELFGRSWASPTAVVAAEAWKQSFAQVLKTSFTKVAP